MGPHWPLHPQLLKAWAALGQHKAAFAITLREAAPPPAALGTPSLLGGWITPAIRTNCGEV